MRWQYTRLLVVGALKPKTWLFTRSPAGATIAQFNVFRCKIVPVCVTLFLLSCSRRTQSFTTLTLVTTTFKYIHTHKIMSITVAVFLQFYFKNNKRRKQPPKTTFRWLIFSLFRYLITGNLFFNDKTFSRWYEKKWTKYFSNESQINFLQYYLWKMPKTVRDDLDNAVSPQKI